MKQTMRSIINISIASLALGLFNGAFAAPEVKIPMMEVDAAGKTMAIGTVMMTESPWGVIITPDLKGLPAGMHGFHLHEKADCTNTKSPEGVTTVAGAAGGHWDPAKTGKHEGPFGAGHMGDLPGLFVASDGTATMPVLVPRIKKLSEVHEHALMVHAGGDNMSDMPMKLGGGGARIACGVIE